MRARAGQARGCVARRSHTHYLKIACCREDAPPPRGGFEGRALGGGPRQRALRHRHASGSKNERAWSGGIIRVFRTRSARSTRGSSRHILCPTDHSGGVHAPLTYATALAALGQGPADGPPRRAIAPSPSPCIRPADIDGAVQLLLCNCRHGWTCSRSCAGLMELVGAGPAMPFWPPKLAISENDPGPGGGSRRGPRRHRHARPQRVRAADGRLDCGEGAAKAPCPVMTVPPHRHDDAARRGPVQAHPVRATGLLALHAAGAGLRARNGAAGQRLGHPAARHRVAGRRGAPRAHALRRAGV